MIIFSISTINCNKRPTTNNKKKTIYVAKKLGVNVKFNKFRVCFWKRDSLFTSPRCPSCHHKITLFISSYCVLYKLMTMKLIPIKFLIAEFFLLRHFYWLFLFVYFTPVFFFCLFVKIFYVKNCDIEFHWKKNKRFYMIYGNWQNFQTGSYFVLQRFFIKWETFFFDLVCQLFFE